MGAGRLSQMWPPGALAAPPAAQVPFASVTPAYRCQLASSTPDHFRHPPRFLCPLPSSPISFTFRLFFSIELLLCPSPTLLGLLVRSHFILANNHPPRSCMSSHLRKSSRRDPEQLFRSGYVDRIFPSTVGDVRREGDSGNEPT